MNLLWRFGPQALSAAILLLATQGVAAPVSSPNLDLSSLGQVALAGNFDAISVYSHTGQLEGINGNGSQAIVSQTQDGSYDLLASTDGSITSMCPFVLKDGTLAGMVVGGNFTSIGGVNSRSVALFNPNTSVITPLPGIQGTVSSLLCDKDTETVYVGGSFEAANSTNAIAWIAAGAWANLPFAGFDAPVNSITKAPNGHVVFGGSFSGLGNTTVSQQSNNQDQAINLVTASISSGGSTTQAGFSDPKNIACPSNGTDGPSSTWLLQDKTPGFWRADFAFGFQPTKLRLWNTNEQDRGTKTWRFTALPNGGILNFTYTDPESGRKEYCDATCPLAHNASNPFQDFEFVNLVGMDSFRIDISDFYGNGGGLDGIELFQSDIFSYAIQDFNEPTCSGAQFVSAATTTGPWYRTPSRQSVSDYLTVVTGPTDVGNTKIVFEPDVKESGNYSIIVYTPGCIQDSSCSARAIVNVSGTLTASGSSDFSTQLFQTNDFDKYDQVFQGHVDASSSSFRPSVTITPSGLQAAQLLVASRIKFTFQSSTGGLNGLFDFDPNQAVVDTNFSKSAINNAGTTLKPDAQVLALTTQGSTIYVAGEFSDDAFKNIMAFNNNKATSLPGNGLNDAIIDMYSMGDFLYVGGNFTNTNTGSIAGLSNVAAYQYSTDSWVPLGAGLDGTVENVEPIQLNVTQGSSETAIAFSGKFTHVQAAGSTPAAPAPGLAIWVPSHNAWLQDINVAKQSLSGQLFAGTFLPNNTWFGAGSLVSQGFAISDVVELQSASSGSVNLQQFPVQISAGNTQQSLQKRDSATQQNVSGIATGVFYNNGGRNLTIFGGHFSATSSSGSNIENLVFLNGSNKDTVTGPPKGMDSNSTVLALALQGDLLLAGGSLSGEINNNPIDGIVMYDLVAANYRNVQPAALVGSDVIVNAVAPQPSSSAVYVGGSFERTSQDLSCPAVCMYDTNTNQWNTVGSGLAGTVVALFWTSNSVLLAAGNLSISGNSTSLATYDTSKQLWSVVDSSGIPGAVTAFAPATSNADHMWVAGTAQDGSTFMMEVDGNNYRPVSGVFEAGTTIRGMQVLSLSQNHDTNQYMDNDQALLVTGQLNITGFGNAAAALYDGLTMTPMILASTGDGQPGSISQLISSNTNTLKSPNRGHSRGITVLVALCAALGTLFLIILIGIIINRIQRRRAGYGPVPNISYADKHANIQRVPPERLFGTLNKPGAPTV